MTHWEDHVLNCKFPSLHTTEPIPAGKACIALGRLETFVVCIPCVLRRLLWWSRLLLCCPGSAYCIAKAELCLAGTSASEVSCWRLSVRGRNEDGPRHYRFYLPISFAMTYSHQDSLWILGETLPGPPRTCALSIANCTWERGEPKSGGGIERSWFG